MKESINGAGAQIVRGATNPAIEHHHEGRQTTDLNRMGSLSCAYSSVGELKTRIQESSQTKGTGERGNSRMHNQALNSHGQVSRPSNGGNPPQDHHGQQILKPSKQMSGLMRDTAPNTSLLPNGGQLSSIHSNQPGNQVKKYASSVNRRNN